LHGVCFSLTLAKGHTGAALRRFPPIRTSYEQCGVGVSVGSACAEVRLRAVSLGLGFAGGSAALTHLAGWGAAALQDHWASAAAPPATSAPFMALYSLHNFYVYMLAYLYSPGAGAPHGPSLLLSYTDTLFRHFYRSCVRLEIIIIIAACRFSRCGGASFPCRWISRKSRTGFSIDFLILISIFSLR
jgi:hypothetical protein